MSLSCNSSPRPASASPLLASTRCQTVFATHVYHCLKGENWLFDSLALIVRDYIVVTHDEEKALSKSIIHALWNQYESSKDPVFITYLKKSPLFQFASLGIPPEINITLRYLVRRIEIMHSSETTGGNSLLDMAQTKPTTIPCPQNLSVRHKQLLQNFYSYIDVNIEITTSGSMVFPFLATGNAPKKNMPLELHPQRFLPLLTDVNEPFLAPFLIDDWRSKKMWCPLCVPLGAPPAFDLKAPKSAKLSDATTLFVPIPRGLNPLRYGTAPWPPYAATFVVTLKEGVIFSHYREEITCME
jgi:hypothetical protein